LTWLNQLRGAVLAATVITTPTGHAATLHTINALPAHRLAAPPQFSAQIDDEPVAGDVSGVFVMPGETVFIDATEVPEQADLHLQTSDHGTAHEAGDDQWHWRAPDAPGLYPLTIRNRATGGLLHLNVLVKTPFTRRRTQLDGYDIGRYQPLPDDRDPVYAPPRGLVQVTAANRNTRIAPHFTLGQFLCHQQPDHTPKALLVRQRLLVKLEHIIAALAEAGLELDTLTVMSGFRTPQYNADIGNTTVYSRHLYGGAADIFVDANEDGEMDDVNADGVINRYDAEWLADLIETVTAAKPRLAGGLSAYPGNGYHGPFVHVDVRGTAVRW